MSYDPRDDVKMPDLEKFSKKIQSKIFEILDLRSINERNIQKVENVIYN
jgi:hypothetical protein